MEKDTINSYTQEEWFDYYSWNKDMSCCWISQDDDAFRNIFGTICFVIGVIVIKFLQAIEQNNILIPLYIITFFPFLSFIRWIYVGRLPFRGFNVLDIFGIGLFLTLETISSFWFSYTLMIIVILIIFCCVNKACKDL